MAIIRRCWRRQDDSGARMQLTQREVDLGEIIIKILIALYLSGTGHTVTITAYSADPAQCNEDYMNGSYGPVAECTVAIDRYMKHRKHGFIFIPDDPECFFIRKINDKMNKRKDMWIDKFYFKKKQALAYGIKRKKFVFIFN